MVAPLAVVAVEVGPALALVPTLLLAVPRTALLPLPKNPSTPIPTRVRSTPRKTTHPPNQSWMILFRSPAKRSIPCSPMAPSLARG